MRTTRSGRFTVDRENGKLLGVCAGIARYTGWDATLIRVAAVVVTIMGAFPWTLIAYGAAYLIANKGGRERGFRPARPIASREETRERVRNLDLRMQAIETYVTSSNSRLAREIEELR